MQPVLIYAWLQSGAIIAGIEWVMIILVASLAGFYARPLKPQEIFVIWTFITGATGGWFVAFGGFGFGSELYRYSGAFFFMGPIQNMYLANNPLTMQFGYTQYLPPWFAPPLDSPVSQGIVRNFFHPDIMLPLTVMVLNGIFGLIVGISLGYLNYQISAQEKLDFPLQTAFAGGVYAVSEESPARKALLLGAFISFLVGVLWFSLSSAGLLFYTGAVDLFRIIELAGLNGASLGFNVQLWAIGFGWVLPKEIVIVSSVAAFLVYFVGNHLLVRFDIWTSDIGRWLAGSGIQYIKEWSDLRFWTSILTGLVLAAAIVPLLRRPKFLIGALRSLTRISTGQKRAGAISVWWVLSLFLAGSIGSSLLLISILPGFPVWLILFLMIVWPFFATLVSVNVAGRTGVGVAVPNFENNLLILAGYSTPDKLAPWFAPIYVSPWISGATQVATGLVTARQVRVKPSEFIKVHVLVTVLSWISSFAFISLFWYSAPIPSAVYPFAEGIWPQLVTTFLQRLKWMQSGFFFRPQFVTAGLVAGSALYLIGDFLRVPFLLPAVLLGLGTRIDFPMAWLIGAGMQVVMRRILGETWDANKNNLFVGFGAGSSIFFALLSTYNLILMSRWVVPY